MALAQNRLPNRVGVRTPRRTRKGPAADSSRFLTESPIRHLLPGKVRGKVLAGIKPQRSNDE